MLDDPRAASLLRNWRTALYHMFVLPQAASASFRSGPRSLPFRSRTDPETLSFRGRGIRHHARTRPPSDERTGSGHAVDCDASREAAHRSRVVAEEKETGPAADGTV